MKKALELYTPSRSEAALANMIKDKCVNELGFEQVNIDNVGNIIATKGTGEPRILLCGHMDTVPGQVPVRIEDGHIYGRGASDAKAPLIAMLLADWDNKEANQRLLCLGEKSDDDRMPECRRPLVMLQDVGATFGPTKVNFDAWKALPIWHDVSACVVSMDDMPYGGGTFLPVKISEAGRRALASRLTQLTDAQLRAMFLSARFPTPGVKRSVSRGIPRWSLR